MNETFPKIIIIILNWNGEQDTLECLESLEKVDYPNYQVAVVDNCSTDNSVASIRQYYPQISLIQNKENLGYAGGNNVGIDYARANGGDYILLLNNDTTVDSQCLLTLLKATQEYPDAGILGSKIFFYRDPEKVWYSGTKWLPEQARFVHRDDVAGGQDTIVETDYVCGCSFLIKSEVIDKIGTLDSRYFLTWEETDYCYRAKKAGYRCLLVPSSVVWHKISASFEGGANAPHYQYFWWRNRFLWIENHIEFSQSLIIYWSIFKQVVRQVRQYFDSEATDAERLRIKAAWQGVTDYLFRRFGDCPNWIRAAMQKS